MEAISVFDIFKVGVGPSSSHTMGPWRAAQRFLACCRSLGCFDAIERVRVDLYGSLAKTGRGHGTDVAVVLGLCGEDPEHCETRGMVERAEAAGTRGELVLAGQRAIPFDRDADLRFHADQTLPFHANGLRFTALLADGSRHAETYYSVGGGFIVQEDEAPTGARAARLPYPIDRGEQIEEYCRANGATIPEIVRANERTWRSDGQIDQGLERLWRVMRDCAYRGCHTDGVLPGGLNVTRRAADLNSSLLEDSHVSYADTDGWLAELGRGRADFASVLKWVSAFAMAVNEENAAFGRVVTAPTNGAAGVIPAVLLYATCFADVRVDGVREFLLTAGEIGSLFKKGATISAAMGGCQAEIGVSSAMAAAGLAQCLGGSVGQVLQAAEIAMEHHLGMTCDPIGGLVQIPCIERNTMGAMKAITAAKIALESDPTRARVSLDGVIKTMWETARDMGSKYKETAEGGLAVHVSVSISEC